MNTTPNTNLKFGAIVTPADKNASGTYPVALSRSFNASNQSLVNQILTGSVYIDPAATTTATAFGIYMAGEGTVQTIAAYDTGLTVQGGFKSVSGNYQPVNPDGEQVGAFTPAGLALYNDTSFVVGLRFSDAVEAGAPVMLLRPGGMFSVEGGIYDQDPLVLNYNGLSTVGNNTPLAGATYLNVFPYHDATDQGYAEDASSPLNGMLNRYRMNYIQVLRNGYGIGYAR